MQPSVKEVYIFLGWTASLTIGALGLLNLSLAVIPETSARVLRAITWGKRTMGRRVLLRCWGDQIPPPLISAAIIETVIVASLVSSLLARRHAPQGHSRRIR